MTLTMAPPRSPDLVAVATALLVLVAACGPDEPADARCAAAQDHSDLEWIQENVFDRSCANFSACHMGSAASAGGLNLEAGNAAAAMIDVPSDLAADLGFQMDLVEPGAPEESYLLHILGHYGQTIEENPRIEPSVGLMPFNNNLLCVEKIDAIERWIASL